jgi:hypothetical protein
VYDPELVLVKELSADIEGLDENVDVTLGETVIDADADLVPVTVALFEGVGEAVPEREGVTVVEEVDDLDAEVEGEAEEDLEALTDSDEEELAVGEGEIFDVVVPVLDTVAVRVTVDVLVADLVTVVVLVDVNETAAVFVGCVDRVGFALFVAVIEDQTTVGLAVFVDDFVGAVDRDDVDEGRDVLVDVGVTPVFKTAALFGSFVKPKPRPITPGSPPARARLFGTGGLAEICVRSCPLKKGTFFCSPRSSSPPLPRERQANNNSIKSFFIFNLYWGPLYSPHFPLNF